MNGQNVRRVHDLSTMSSQPEPDLPERPTATLDSAAGLLTPAQRHWVAEHTLRAIDALGVTGDVRVRLVADDEMALAHEQYCGVPGTTDVITFDLAEGAAAEGEPLDVDLLVCVDEAMRQSATRGHTIEREVLLYVVHGILHCLGHDDHDDEQSRVMHQREDDVLQAIGVGVTFATAADNAGAQS